MAIREKNGNFWIDTYVKGKRIRRMIGPDKEVAELVADWVETVLREARTPFQERVMTKPDGGPCPRVERPFARALDRAGLPKIRIHDLRHSFASNLVMNGTPLNVVQELLGHKNIQTTMVYAHLASNAKRAAIDSLVQREVPINEEERMPAVTG